MTIAINLAKYLLNFIYLFFKLFKRRKQITLISRESNTITTDFELLKGALEKELPDYKIVVLCKMMDNKISYCFHMLKQMYHISRSKVIILDTYCITASMLKHKKGLEIVQIWHAIGAMKKAGYSILGKGEGRNEKISKAACMHKGYTHVYTSSDACNKVMSEVFNCDIEICKSVPLPRIDLLKDKKYINKTKESIYKKYPILKNKKNVVYAPTFRKDETRMQLEIDKLIKTFDYKNYNLILKLHPLSKLEIKSKKAIVDKTFTTSQMMYISDYVISDYSSIIYEAGILNKKLIYFAFDIDEYKDSRSFFIDYDKELNGPIIKDANEIMEFIKKGDYSKYKDKNLISKYVDITIDNYSKNMALKIKELL